MGEGWLTRPLTFSGYATTPRLVNTPAPPARASTERCLRITLNQTTEKCPGFIYLFQVYLWFFATPMCA